MAATLLAETTNDNWQHLRDELELLNADLLREVRHRTDNRQQGQLDQLQGLVISEHEIVSILTDGVGETYVRDDEDIEHRLQEIVSRISQRRDESRFRVGTQLDQIAGLFRLDRNEVRCLILCLAPEIDSNYSKVFAFLQDDITKKQPSIDLALRLLFRDLPQRLTNRSIFSLTSPLLKNRLLHCESAGRQESFPQITLKLDDRIASFLLESPQLDESLVDWVDSVMPTYEESSTVIPNEVRNRTLRLVEHCFSGGDAPIRPLIHLHGRKGSGRRSLAADACRQIGLSLLVADVKRMPAGLNGVEAFWRLGRESLLLPAVVLIEEFDYLLADDRIRELTALLEAVNSFSPLTFLSGTKPWKADSSEQIFLSLECPVPDSTTRMHLWRKHLDGCGNALNVDHLIELSSKFNFTEGQIRQTIETARNRAEWENQPTTDLSVAQLSQASRSVATPNLSGLARKIEPLFTWSDIVLPDAQLSQLRELVAHVKRAQIVFENWGFAGKFAYGKGVTALFDGLSGTGKTMAAGIIGAALALDLYKIDLSSVVSKYIGETEKNLERIFTEAQDSNAILFFDEADALFGKRAEVKDAHDRYANIETAYLLQRMEEYSGIVIMATNMKQNVDEAFVRRMRFIVHFPFPCDEDRKRIWQTVFPAGAPMGNIDFDWLARNLKITGGNIKNISLRAAFLAIEREGVIGMDCLVDAAKREMEKIGKISTLAEFKAEYPTTETLRVAEVA